MTDVSNQNTKRRERLILVGQVAAMLAGVAAILLTVTSFLPSWRMNARLAPPSCQRCLSASRQNKSESISERGARRTPLRSISKIPRVAGSGQARKSSR